MGKNYLKCKNVSASWIIVSSENLVEYMTIEIFDAVSNLLQFSLYVNISRKVRTTQMLWKILKELE